MSAKSTCFEYSNASTRYVELIAKDVITIDVIIMVPAVIACSVALWSSSNSNRCRRRGGSMRGTRVTDMAEYLIENSKCNCVAVQKKGQNGGYLLNTKTYRNFWLLAWWWWSTCAFVFTKCLLLQPNDRIQEPKKPQFKPSNPNLPCSPLSWKEIFFGIPVEIRNVRAISKQLPCSSENCVKLCISPPDSTTSLLL